MRVRFCTGHRRWTFQKISRNHYVRHDVPTFRQTFYTHFLRFSWEIHVLTEIVWIFNFQFLSTANRVISHIPYSVIALHFSFGIFFYGKNVLLHLNWTHELATIFVAYVHINTEKFGVFVFLHFSLRSNCIKRRTW